MPEPNGWNEWGKYVLKELERLNDVVNRMPASYDAKHNEIIERITKLDTSFKVFQKEMGIKSGVWGLIGGAIPVAVMLAFILMKQ